eukprot:m.145098 g.145098  ORF g.145098 m.145098 type:complete len:386 (-) comp14112_c0_seq1:152-1309(-)
MRRRHGGRNEAFPAGADGPPTQPPSTAAPAPESAEFGADGASRPLQHPCEGVYRRCPVENGWHVGRIVVEPPRQPTPPALDHTVGVPDFDMAAVHTSIPPPQIGTIALRWVNEAGAEWGLELTDNPDALRTGPSNPYHETCPEFHLLRDEGRIVGFEFNGEIYEQCTESEAAGAVPQPLPTHPLGGLYRRFPVENPWHIGTVDVAPSASGDDSAGGASEALRWANDAGVEWGLGATGEADVWQTEEGNPYRETQPTFTFKRAAEGDVVGFEFGPDFFRLAERHPIEGRYARASPENGWHVGVIEAFEDVNALGPGVEVDLPPLGLRWMNEAGVGWELQPTEDPDVFATGDTNPYRDSCPNLSLIRGESDNRVIGFHFNGDDYMRT